MPPCRLSQSSTSLCDEDAPQRPRAVGEVARGLLVDEDEVEAHAARSEVALRGDDLAQERRLRRRARARAGSDRRRRSLDPRGDACTGARRRARPAARAASGRRRAARRRGAERPAAARARAARARGAARLSCSASRSAQRTACIEPYRRASSSAALRVRPTLVTKASVTVPFGFSSTRAIRLMMGSSTAPDAAAEGLRPRSPATSGSARARAAPEEGATVGLVARERSPRRLRSRAGARAPRARPSGDWGGGRRGERRVGARTRSRRTCWANAGCVAAWPAAGARAPPRCVTARCRVGPSRCAA